MGKIKVLAMEAIYYSPKDGIKLGKLEHMRLTYAPRGEAFGGLYGPPELGYTTQELEINAEDFDNYNEEKFILAHKTEKIDGKLFPVMDEDGKPVMVEKSLGRGSMLRVGEEPAIEPKKVVLDKRAKAILPKKPGPVAKK